MDHSYFKDRISAYYDRDLPPYELQAVREHLQDCAECQALLGELEKLDRMVAEKSELAGDDYWEQSAQKIERALGVEEKTEVVDIKSKSWHGLGWKIATVAASLAVITFIGLHEGDILKDQTLTEPARQLESPKLDDFDAVELPEGKTEAVADSAPMPVVVDEAVERAGVRSTPTDADVVDRIGASVQSEEPDVAEVSGKKGTNETTADLSNLKVISQRDMIDQFSTEDSAVLQPVSAEKQAVTPLASPKGPPVVLSKEKADHSLALTDAVNIGAAGAAELPDLRQKRDSLMVLYQAKSISRADMEVSEMAAAPEKRIKAAKAAAVDSTAHLFERELVDIHYRIAQLTEDKNEREASTRFLRVYADRTDAPYADRARKYLDSIISADE